MAMRITGGILCGRRIRVPKAVIRPTQDRVREALFSMLGDRVRRSGFLDLFAGSGAVGLEAWSREAELVCWVESDPCVLSVLKQNVRQLCNKQVRIYSEDAVRFLKKGLADRQFDIIFADPPYGRRERGPKTGKKKEVKKRGRTRLDEILNAIRHGDMLAPGGLFIMEHASDEDLTRHEGWQLVNDKAYGDTKLSFFERKR